MAAPPELKYRAFLSYAHADARWGKWLHSRLEGFSLGTELSGRQTALGRVPDTLRPIFRDREEFSAGHTLTEATLAALDQSAALIVLCSTVAATRPAVDEEVRLFRWRHPGRPVIPVIVDGRYPDNFPPALRCRIGADGSLTDSAVTILGPDLRESGDGRTLGLAKIVAGLTGLPPDDIFRRAERERRRQARVRGAVAAVMAALAVAGGVLYLDAQRKGETIVQQRQEKTEALALARKLLADNPSAAAKPGQEDSLVAALTAIRESADTGDADAAKAEELIKAGKAADAVPLLIASAEARQRRAAKESKDAAKAYRSAAAIAAVAEPGRARDLYAAAARLDPDDVEGLFQHGWFQQQAGQLAAAAAAYRAVVATGKPGSDDWVLYWSRLGLGDIQMQRGALAAALATYKEAGAVADRQAHSNPGVGSGHGSAATLGWQRDLSASYSKVGDVLVAQGNLAGALRSFRDGRAIMDRLATSDPGNAGWQRDLSVSYEKVGDVLVAQGNLADALRSFRDGLVIRERLATSDPGNAGWQRDLSVSYEKVGDVLVAQGNLPDAVRSYRDGLGISERLAKSDSGNAGWQRDLSVSYSKVGDVLVAQGNLADALRSYRDVLAISERLAKSDPGNAGWQRDLSVSYNKVGDVLVAQGNLADAVRSYRDGLAIRERLAKSDPGNAGWQRDLSVSYEKVGDVLVAQGNLADALRSFRDGLVIRERLATSDPGNANWQRDLAVSNERVGDIYSRQGNVADAQRSFAQALAIYDELAARNPDDVPSRVNSVVPHWRLAALDPSRAREHLSAALAVLKPLAAANRLDAKRAGWIAKLEAQLAALGN